MARFVDLANELLLEVFGLLPGSDLKTIRLVCKELEPLASPSLYRRVHLAPNYEALRRFESVHQHPVIRDYVKEVVYDAAHYEEWLADPYGEYSQVQSDALGPEHYDNLRFTEPDEGKKYGECYYEKINNQGRLFSMTLDTLVSEGRKVYQRYFREQEDILQLGRISSHLKQGLACMPHVKRITICDGVLQDNGRATELPGLSFESNGMPVVSRSSWPGCCEVKDHDRMEQVDGFAAILTAIGLTTNQSVRDLCITSVYPQNGIPYSTMELLAQDNACLIDLRKGVANLRRLEIRIGHDNDTYQVDWDGEEDTGALVSSFLSRLLHAARELRVLVLHPNSHWRHAQYRYEHPLFPEPVLPLGSLLGNNAQIWPHLAELDLCGVRTRASDLTNTLRRQSSNLRRLALNYIYLEGPRTDWVSILEEMQGFLTLDHARVRNLFDRQSTSSDPRCLVYLDKDGEIGRYLVEGGVNPLRLSPQTGLP